MLFEPPRVRLSPKPYMRFVASTVPAIRRILGPKMLSDPAAAAWRAAGQPTVEGPPPTLGKCGRCGATDLTVASSRIVSEFFTGFEAWPYGSRRLCVPCTWGYTNRPADAKPLLITTDTVTEYSDASHLCEVLTAGALPANSAVVVPAFNKLRRRHHILPTTQWAHLATDTLLFPWDTGAAQRLADLAWLRHSVGASWSQLQRAAPEPKLITTRPHQSWPRILTAWTQLQPWRRIPPLWDAARSLTAPPKP